MKIYVFILSVILVLFLSCDDSDNTITESLPKTGIKGQIFANAGPGFTPVNITATVIVLNIDSTTKVTEILSDTSGRYEAELSPGKYVLYVKESRDIYFSGPYEVVEGSYTETKAYLYDSRIVFNMHFKKADRNEVLLTGSRTMDRQLVGLNSGKLKLFI